MAKQIYVPDLSTVEAVFDVLTDPAKYAKYLQVIREAHQELTEKLRTVQTQSEADRLVAEAHDMVEQADAYSRRIRDEADAYSKESRESCDLREVDLVLRVKEYESQLTQFVNERALFQQDADLRKKELQEVSEAIANREAKAEILIEKYRRLSTELEEKRAQAEAQLKAWS